MNHLICLTLTFLSLIQPLIMAAENNTAVGNPHAHAHGGGTKRARYHGAHRQSSGPSANNADAETLSDTSAQGAGVHSSDAHIAATGPPADITKACAMAKDKNFCIKTLTTNPKSKGLDMKQLALLAVQMVQEKGMENEDYVDQKLQEEEKLPKGVSSALNDCSDQYSDALAQIDDAIDALFNVIPYNDMRTWLSSAAMGADVCQRGIVESKANNMFENNGNIVFAKLCENALSIIITMQSSALEAGTAKALS